MKTKCIALGALLIPSISHGATGVFGSYLEIFTTSGTVYVAQQYTGSNPSFNGANLGTFDLTDDLSISRASLLTWKSDEGGVGDVTGAEIQYRVYPTSGSPGSFTTVALGFGSNAPSTDLGGNGFGGGGDQEWRSTINVDLMAAAGGTGDYTVEVFYRAFTNEGDRFSNNGGANYTATFSIIPEPSTALLGGLGMLALLRRRRA